MREAAWGVCGRKGRVEAGPPRANPAGSWAPRGCLSKQLGGPHSFGQGVQGRKNSRKPGRTAPSLAPWLELRHGDESTTYLCSVHHNRPGFWIQWGRHLYAAHSGWGRSCHCCHTQVSCEVCIAETDHGGCWYSQGWVCVCATHTHTHTHTHSHLVKSPPQQRWLLPCQGTGSLSSGISNPTLLSVGGITSPCSPSWCSVLILALGHLFFSVKRNTHSLTPILSNQQEGHFIRSQESGLSITLSLCRKSFNVCIENPLKFQNFMTQNSQSWEFGNIERNVSTAPDPHHTNSSIISGSSYKNLCSVALFSILFFS